MLTKETEKLLISRAKELKQLAIKEGVTIQLRATEHESSFLAPEINIMDGSDIQDEKYVIDGVEFTILHFGNSKYNLD